MTEILAENFWLLDLSRLAALPILIALNGLFVAAEFSLVAVRRTRVEELVRQGESGADTLEKAIHHLTRSIAATQLGITLASLALGWVAEPALYDLLELFFPPQFRQAPALHTTAIVVAFLLITFLHVVFGELIPKTLALRGPDHVALWLAKPLVVFARLTRPLIIVINSTANLVLRMIGYAPNLEAASVHSIEELALLVEDTEEAGLLDSDQAEFVQNVFRLSNKRVRECLVPRERMASLELSAAPDKVLEAVRHGAHTRMPVYEGNLDNIVGIVNTKDLFYLFSLQGIVVLQDAMYPPLFLKPEETLDDALRLFRKARRPMALVRDDENKILGLLTLEDVLEEIVGDIEDEHDQPRPQLARWKGHAADRARLAAALGQKPPPKPAPAPVNPRPVPPPRTQAS